MGYGKMKRQPLAPPPRAESVRFAVASTVMEGIPVSADTEQLLAEWAQEAISNEELTRRSLEPETAPSRVYRAALGE